MQIGAKLLTDRQTNNDEKITPLAEVITVHVCSIIEKSV